MPDPARYISPALIVLASAALFARTSDKQAIQPSDLNDVNVVTGEPQKPVNLPAIVDLRRLLRDDRRPIEVKIEACDEFAAWGPRAWSAVPELVSQLRNRGTLGRHAMNALLANDPGQVARALTDAVESNDPLSRAVAAGALAEMSSHSDLVVPRVTKLLRLNDPKVRDAAGSLVEQMGSPGSRAVPLLLAELRNADAKTGDTAAAALRAIHDNDETIAKALGDLLDEPLVVRRRAAFALGGEGARPRQVLGKLKEVLADDDMAVRRDAAIAVSHIGPDAAAAVPALAANLGHGDESSLAAAEALGAIGVAARGSMPALIAAIRNAPLNRSAGDAWNDSDKLRSAYATALARIDPGGKENADLLVESVRKRDWVVREAIAPSLAESPERPSVTVALVGLTNDPNDLVRVNAQCALRELNNAVQPTTHPVR